MINSPLELCKYWISIFYTFFYNNQEEQGVVIAKNREDKVDIERKKCYDEFI